MENKPYKRIPVLRPTDRSLGAYKAWMMDLAKQLSPEKAEINWTEQEWIANWEKFWKEKPLEDAHFSLLNIKMTDKK